jgi:hypothetical protein
MYYAQLRYWGDHPRLDQIAASYFKLPNRKTPPPARDGSAAVAIDRSLLAAPLTAAELGRVAGTPI